MVLKLLVIVILIKTVVAAIELQVNVNENKDADLTYNGTEARKLTDEEIHTIMGKENLRKALIENIRLLGLYRETEICGSPNRVLSIKSAMVKRLNMKPVIVVSQDFDNFSNHTIKVNAGISHSVENTLTTSWSKEREYSVTQDIDYRFSMGFLGFGPSFGGKSGFSFATRGGVNEQHTQTNTIGTTSGMEVELKPGDAVTAVLSASAGSLEVEVVHEAYLKGDVPINCDCDILIGFRPHITKVCESIEGVMESGGIKNNLTTTEKLEFSFYVEGKLSVFERKSGKLILLL